MLSASELQLNSGQHVELTLPRGELHCVSGASGVGKTLLLRALADLDPVAGQVTLNGAARESMPASQWRQQVMLVPATPRWWLPTPAQHMAAVCDAQLLALRLQPQLLHAPCQRLSTGESLRLALLRALAAAPAVLLLDEPTAALDSEATAAVETVVSEYARDHAVLWITHDPAQARRIAHQRWQLDDATLRATA